MTQRSIRTTMMVAVVGAAALCSAALPASAQSRCERRYRDLQIPSYDRRVIVRRYLHLSCSTAARIASATVDAYERGLPTVDLPPPPAGVPGGQGRTFTIRTRTYGTYTCRLTARGSDFVEGRCRRGERFVDFLSLNHYWLHGR